MKRNSEIAWVAVSVIGMLLLISGYVLANHFSTSYDGGNNLTSQRAGWLVLLGGVIFLVGCTASVKIKSQWRKGLAIFACIIDIIVIFLAFFMHRFLMDT